MKNPIRLTATVVDAGVHGRSVWVIFEAAGRRIYTECEGGGRAYVSLMQATMGSGKSANDTTELKGRECRIDVEEVAVQGGVSVLVAVGFFAL